MKPSFIDIHSHIYFPQYDTDRVDVIARMKETQTASITIGTNTETSRKAIDLAEEHACLFACVGLHPVGEASMIFKKEDYIPLITHPKVVAIGECGLDYGKTGHVEPAEKARQVQNFEEHIECAVMYDKPLMLHIRNAHDDVLDILRSKQKTYGEKVRGNVHFFSGSAEIAKQFVEIGYSCSFTGVITFVSEYDEAVKYMPLDMIMSETDAPFVAPVPYRGKRNEPVFVEHVVKRMAEIKNVPYEEMKRICVENACRHFKLDFK